VNKTTGTNKNTILLGNLVAAAFDRAATVTSDPAVAARLATYTVSRFLARTQRFDLIDLLDQQVASRVPPARQAA
jgi:hypothetical protein